ncbi:M20/M25/M40 family metallo-hydrolase [Sabulicella glaciei]|uniref:M20/M25/M40 family metallo-hydrolase n=1 Tax=Sabulicella glaciei TaxID=2984948 RepID=A0ABT3P1S2_9PROT|nr:M20/M25/M40 family metallo-hydrolase [Roseococcus sp. MDT2-1-1]
MADATREGLIRRLEEEREGLIAFLQGFLRARSANPPGDTTEAATFLGDWLDKQGAPWRIAAAKPHLPNIVGSFEGARPGRHLVLNGHIDVFPPLDESGWSGERRDGRIFGRGASDMKAGTAAGVIAYAWLHGLREQLGGRLTLTAVSDEQTGGEFGTRWLFETMRDEVLGDCCLNGEPSGLNNVRFMEKGTLRVIVTIRAPGGHGGYPHLSRNPVKIAAEMIAEFERRFHMRETVLPEAVSRALTTPEAVAVLEAGMGAGAAEVVRRMTFNPGVIQGGLKVNQIPHECRFEVDLRIPVGIDRDAVLDEVKEVCAAHEAEFSVVHSHSYPGSMADPESEMMRIIQDNAEAATGRRPVPMSSLGGSDSRYWRYEGVPAYLYGPSPVSMGRGDENVSEEEYLAVVRVHLLSAYDYLRAGG